MTIFHFFLAGLFACLFIQWLWRRSTTRTQITRARQFKDAAWSLWLTPTIMLFPFIALPLMMDFRSAVESVLDAWQIYLYFFALPYLAGLFFWIHARRLERRP